MKKVLVINSSARAHNSRSRKLTEIFIDHWKSIHIDPVINFCELGNADVPHINENWIAAAFKPEAARSEDNMQNPYIGLLENKTLFLLLSRGARGYEKGGYNEHMNFQSTYLKTVFNIIGISNIHVTAINEKSFDAGLFQKSADNENMRDLIKMELVDTRKIELITASYN